MLASFLPMHMAEAAPHDETCNHQAVSAGLVKWTPASTLGIRGKAFKSSGSLYSRLPAASHAQVCAACGSRPRPSFDQALRLPRPPCA